MTELFLHLLNISITASYMIIAVLLLRLLLKKAPKNYTCILWGLVGLRLSLPFNIESIFSLIPSGETITPTVFSEKNSGMIIDTGFENINSVVNPTAQAYVENNEANLKQLVFIASVIWLSVGAIMLIFGLISFFRLKFKLRFSVRTKEGYYRCESVKSPFISGIIKPKIYLPFSINKSDEEFIIKHEKAHISRLDHITKLLAFILLAVYWFNPLVWLYYLILQKDIEAACDQKVIKNMETESRQLYSITLLKYSVSPKLHTLTPIAFGEISVKQRIKGVMSYKKPTLWLIIVFLLIILIAVLGFMTTPVKNATASIENPSIISKDSAPKDASNKKSDPKYNELIEAIENGTYNQSLSEFEALLGGASIKNDTESVDNTPDHSVQNNSKPTDNEATPVSAKAIDSQTKTKRIVIDASNWKNYYEIVYKTLKQTNEGGETTTITFPYYVKLKDGYNLAPDYGERKTTVEMRYRYDPSFYYCSFDKNGNITALYEKINLNTRTTYTTLSLNDYTNNFHSSNQIYSLKDGKANTLVISNFNIVYFDGELYLLDK